MITHPTPVRNAHADMVCDPAATFVFRTAADAAVATLAFSTPTPFAAAADGIKVANAITEDSNAAGGIVDNFVILDGEATPAPRFFGEVTVVGGGGDAEFDVLAIDPGDTVRINSMSYVASP